MLQLNFSGVDVVVEKSGNSVGVGREVGAVVQALKVLRVLAASREPMPMTAISRAANISPSTCLNLLRTMSNERLLGFDSGKKTYKLDLGVLELARPLINQSQVELLRPHLMTIAVRFGALVSVWLPGAGENMLLIDRVVPDVEVRVEMRLATKLPIAAGAAGRAVIAAMGLDEIELRRLFGEVRWVRSLGFDEFVGQVKLAGQQGYAVDDSSLIGGVVSVASCILGVGGKPVMALSVATLKGQQDSEGLKLLGEELNALSRWAERALFGDKE